MSVPIREREDDNSESRSPKRTKTTDSELDDNHGTGQASQLVQEPNRDEESILPPSYILLGLSLPQTTSDGLRQLRECDVGISEYIARDLPSISCIIKQR